MIFYIVPLAIVSSRVVCHLLIKSQISFTGVAINLYLFVQFLSSKKKPFESFQKLCLAKTVPNLIITGYFAFLSVPLSVLRVQPEDVPIVLNIAVFEVIGGIAYVLGPLFQICMAVNRFIVLYFPFAKMKFGDLPSTHIAIAICVVLACTSELSCVYSELQESSDMHRVFPANCFLLYDPINITFYIPVENCSDPSDFSMLMTICALSAVSNSINMMIFMKLLKDKMSGMSDDQKSARRKRFLLMFTQSVIQDLLQVIDTINYTFVAPILDEPWWAFLFACVSFVMVYVLDGSVMMYFHSEIKVCCFKKDRKVTEVTAQPVSEIVSTTRTRIMSMVSP